MNVNQVIEYICELLNIDTSNSIVHLDMLEDLKAIKDLSAFRYFLKERVGNLNANSDDFRFLKGFQKFNRLVYEFKKIKDKPTDDKIKDYCSKLVEKCRVLSVTAYENKPKGYNFDDFIYTAKYEHFSTNGKPYFIEKETELLDMVGGCSRLLRDYDSNLFFENLVSAVYRLRKNNTLAIENKSQVMKWLGK